MSRSGWVAAGFLAVAGVASYFTLPDPPREAEADVDGAFEASVKEPQRGNPMLLASAETAQRFQIEPHDAAAARVESAVQAAFAHDDVEPELFKSVACRKTLCKLSVRMNKARVSGYHRAMSTLREAGFSAEPDAAQLFDPPSDPGEVELDMYLSHAGVQTPQP